MLSIHYQRPQTSVTNEQTTNNFDQSHIQEIGFPQQQSEQHIINQTSRNGQREQFITSREEGTPHNIMLDQQSPLSFRASWNKSIQVVLPQQQYHSIIQSSIVQFSKLVDQFQLSETQHSPNKQKCSCFGSSDKSAVKEKVKNLFMKLGGDKFNPDVAYHRDTLFSIYCYLTECNQITQYQFQDFAEKVEIYYQILSFLSCLEMEQSFFKYHYQHLGQQLIDIMLKIGSFVFDQLKTKKLDGLIRNNQNYLIFNILRNYQVGIVQHLICDMKKQDWNIEQILQFYNQKYQPTHFLTHYLKNSKSDMILY